MNKSPIYNDNYIIIMHQTTKSLTSITIIYAIGNITSKSISFVLVFVITFYLTKEDVGRYDIIITTISLFIPLINLQLTDGILRWLLDNTDITVRKKVLTNSLLIFFVNSLIFTTLYWIIIQFINEDLKFIIYGLLLIQSLFPLIQIFVRGIGANVLFALSGIIYSLFYTGITIVCLLVLKLKIEGLLMANIFATLITVLFVSIFGKLYRFISIKYIDKKFVKEIIVFSIPIIPNAYSWWLFSSANRYIILYFFGLELCGIWSISYKIPTILTIFTSLFFMAWQEKSIREFKNTNRDEYFSNVLNTFISLTLGLIIILVASSKTILYYVVEKSFFISWKYTTLLLMASFFQSLSLFYSVGYVYAKETKKILYTTLTGAFVSIVFSFLLIPFFHLYGAAAASLLGFFAMFIIRLKQTKKYFDVLFPINKTICLILSIVICNLINYFESFYIQIANIVFAIIVFYITNKLFLKNKIELVKLLLIRKDHDRK